MTLVLALLLAVGQIAQPAMGGRVGYADPSLGRYYLAMRLPAGTRVRVCGDAPRGGCVVRTVNDYGPSSRIRPPRMADLSYRDWLTVCGETDHRRGLCLASAFVLAPQPELPATDTAPVHSAPTGWGRWRVAL